MLLRVAGTVPLDLTAFCDVSEQQNLAGIALERSAREAEPAPVAKLYCMLPSSLEHYSIE
jgi:hypothetical protein